MSKQEHDAKQPLADRTIIITRARNQADEFADKLEQYGARVISCPAIEIIEPENYDFMDDALDGLYGYDWLVFTSVNGVHYFLRRFAARGHLIHELDDLRVCAIGEATSNALRDAEVHVDLVPEQHRAEGVFTALQNYLGDVDAFRTLNFLIPRATVARDFLPLALEEAGARVDVVPAYRTVKPQTAELGRVAALLEGGAIDCVAFASSSAVTNFAQLFDATDLEQLLKGVAVACIGDITAATAALFGLRVDIQPSEQTIPGLARAIANHFSTTN